MKHKPSHEEIVELMMETIIELEDGIKARPQAKRERELTLASSGFSIMDAKDEEEALALT